jgi:energy-converting hydrogenase A subunit R
MWQAQVPEAALMLIVEAEEYLAKEYRQRFSPGGQHNTADLDTALVSYLDNFYLNRLPSAGLQLVEDKSSVVGGRRKVWAVERIARRNRVSLKEVVFIGDSITDAAILQVIDLFGGLAISFNGNQFAIPHATVAVASCSLLPLMPLLESWFAGGRAAVKAFVDRQAAASTTPQVDYIWKPGSDHGLLKVTIARHAVTRQQVRPAAGSLG